MPEDWIAQTQLSALAADAREALGDLREAFASASRALLQAEVSGNQSMVVDAMLRLGRLSQLRGDYNQGLALLGRAVQRSQVTGTESAIIGRAAGVAAAIYLERGQRREAVRVANLAKESGLRFRDNAMQARAALATSLAMQQMGQVEIASSSMARALKLANSLPQQAPERFLVLQAHAAAMLRDGKRVQGLAETRKALHTVSSPPIKPLVEQCELMVSLAGSPRRPSLSGLLRLRRLCGAMRKTDSRRWLSGGLALVAQSYARLGLRWFAASSLRRALALAQEESYIGAPLGLPLDSARLLGVAVQAGVAQEVAGTLLGVEPEAGERVLAPWLAHKRPVLQTRAEQAFKGIQAGAGRAGEALLPWPGIAVDRDGASTGGKMVSPVAPVEIVALGGFRPLVGGRAEEWPSVDARDLAAYLVVNRSSRTTRDRLFRDVWPAAKAEEANVRLHVALYRLREFLGDGYPAVELESEARGLYRWNGLPQLIDVERFRGLLRRVAEAGTADGHPRLSDEALRRLEEAVALYQGEFLDGMGFQWCLAQREELRAMLIAATRSLIDHYMALRQWDDAVRHGLKSLA
ncbi:MAG TPA: BTAD domain-containing putative transcriptional regulator, partial [Chloroflexota bacterium]|nr:BTAD domain-containing putative transcriptional regulator [Chloroflexota bacterium]